MPSPLAHGSLVFVVRAVTARHTGLRRAVGARPAFLYTAAVATLLIPDIDFLIGSIFDSPFLRHGGATHSLAVGVLFGLCFAALCRWRYGAGFPTIAGCALGIGCAWAHPIMDMATWGRGAMVLWPFSAERHRTVTLFFGAHHSQPLAWKLHLITLATELLFVLALWWLARGFWRRTSGPAATSPIGASEGTACRQ